MSPAAYDADQLPVNQRRMLLSAQRQYTFMKWPAVAVNTPAWAPSPARKGRKERPLLIQVGDLTLSFAYCCGCDCRWSTSPPEFPRRGARESASGIVCLMGSATPRSPHSGSSVGSTDAAHENLSRAPRIRYTSRFISTMEPPQNGCGNREHPYNPPTSVLQRRFD